MNNLFLDLDLSRWQVLVLSFFPAAVILSLFVYSGRSFQKTRMNFFFSLFLLVSVGWLFTDGAFHLSRSKETATEWYVLSEVFVVFVVVFGVLFLTQFANWKNKYSGYILTLALLLPAQTFFVMIYTRVDQFELVESSKWYWISNPVPTLPTLTMLSWVTLCAFVMIFIPWALYFRRTTTIEKNQALLLAIGLTIPVMLGIGGEILFPLFAGVNDVPLSAPSMSIFACLAFIAVEKYQLLDYSPKHQWQEIAGSLNDGILIVDNAENIVYANNSFCRLTGYDLDEIKGKSAVETLLEEADRKRMDSVMLERKQMKAGRYELEIRKKTGEKVWVMVQGLPYLDRAGKVVGSIGVQTNITELKKKEKELIHNKNRLSQSQAVAHMGSWELSFATGIAIWSEEACRIYGLPLEEKSTQSYDSWISFIHPDDMEYVLKEIKKSQAEMRNITLTHRIVRKDGIVRHIRSITNFEFNSEGQPTGLFGICHDVTDQKRTEMALLQSEALNRTFVNESSLCIYFVHPEKKTIEYANPAFYRLTGYSELDIINAERLIVESSDGENFMDEAMQSGKSENREMIWKKKNGKTCHMLATAVYKEVNKAKLIYIAAQDITDRIRAEESLKAVNTELETFIYKASHDLRGPLASIMGLVNVSKMEVPEKTNVYLNMIETASMKLDETLLQLTRAMKVKNMQKFSETVQLRSIIKDILKKFEFFNGYSRMSFEINVALKDPFTTNKPVLETIIQNVIENAIKYQRKDEQQPVLKIEALDVGKHVKLIFEDNGIGMEEAVQPRVFDMYFRGTELSQGSGLGLYLVKKGVDLMEGDISLRSAPSKGTVISILLPKREFAEVLNTGLARAAEVQ
jgi:PAS domain S-box-containing protein